MTENDIDVRLAELASRTSVLAPRPGFGARLSGALAAEAMNGFPRELVRSARRFVPFAVLFAALLLAWSTRVGDVSNSELAAAEIRWELDF